MKKHKIIFLATHQWQIDELWEPKAKKIVNNYAFDVEVHLRNELNESEVKQVLKYCDGLITTWGSPICSEKFIKNNAPNLKIIGHAAGSIANIVDESTYSTDVKIITANQIMAQSVAEWSLLATLLAVRNMGASTAWFGKTKMNFSKAYEMSDIENSTIGIWGFGDTTKYLLKFLEPLNPGKILVASEHGNREVIAEFGAEKVSFETVLKEADVFHALVGLNQQNFERLGTKEFTAMKEGATFINCGRSRLTNEAELIEVLKKQRINAILDVFNQEPLGDDSQFYSLSNVILTPHNAGYPRRSKFIPFIFEEFARFFNGLRLNSAVSKERFLTMTNEKLKC